MQLHTTNNHDQAADYHDLARMSAMNQLLEALVPWVLWVLSCPARIMHHATVNMS